MSLEACADAEDKIAAALKKDSSKLDLSGLGLETLPESLGQLKNLQQINLSQNQLSSLPESLGKLAAESPNA